MSDTFSHSSLLDSLLDVGAGGVAVEGDAGRWLLRPSASEMWGTAGLSAHSYAIEQLHETTG